jgi:hypothetical protein
MPPRRRAPVPIPIDIEAVRRKLAEGKIVRVGISRSAQFPDGGTGRVRHVGSPEVDGDEYVQVELSLNGTRDILPFTPADLTPATRAKPAPEAIVRKSAQRANGVREPGPVPSSLLPADSLNSAAPATATGVGSTSSTRTNSDGSTPAPPPVDSPTGKLPATSAGTSPARAKASPATTAQAPVDTSTRTIQASSTGSTGGTGTTARTKASRGARRTPPVSISIATTETDPTQWRIEARVGARVVLRSGSVSPARVWDLVRQLEEPTLIAAVGGILDEQRKAAQARADALTAELAKVQAELEALPRHH